MTGYPTQQVAAALIDERLRTARERRRAVVPEPPRGTISDDAHAYQRALVIASLMFSRRQDAPTHRRSA